MKTGSTRKKKTMQEILTIEIKNRKGKYLLGEMYFPLILNCWLLWTQHDKQLVKTVENLNGLCFRISVFPINTFYKELFQKCVNCRHHTKKCQRRQGKHKAYKKRKSKILTQPHFDFIKLFVDLFRIWQFWGWLTDSLEWKYEEHMYLSFVHFADLFFFGGWRVVSLTTKTC